MKHMDAVRTAVEKKIADHLKSVSKLKGVLRAIDTLVDKEPKPMVKAKLGYTQRGLPRQRVRRVRIKTKCVRCGRTFIAQRHSSGKRPVLYCHKPCTSNMYHKEQAKKREQYRAKPVTLLPGDALSAHN